MPALLCVRQKRIVLLLNKATHVMVRQDDALTHPVWNSWHLSEHLRRSQVGGDCCYKTALRFLCQSWSNIWEQLFNMATFWSQRLCFMALRTSIIVYLRAWPVCATKSIRGGSERRDGMWQKWKICVFCLNYRLKIGPSPFIYRQILSMYPDSCDDFHLRRKNHLAFGGDSLSCDVCVSRRWEKQSLRYINELSLSNRNSELITCGKVKWTCWH